MKIEKNLMYVASTNGNQLTLSGVGSSIGVCLRVNVPLDVISELIGRQVWVNGGWGGICAIHSWPDLPKAPTETKP